MMKAHIDATKAQNASTNYPGNNSTDSYNKPDFPTKPQKSNFNAWKTKFTDTRDSNFLFATYHPDQVTDIIKEIRDNNFALETGANDRYGSFTSQYSKNLYCCYQGSWWRHSVLLWRLCGPSSLS